MFGTAFSGTIGDDIIASSWKGHAYIKRYVIPANPRTELQVKQRAIFTRGVRTWRTLSAKQQEFYGRIAEGMSGYNVFVHRFMEALRAGAVPELPIPLEYATSDGQPVPDGTLVVRGKGRELFVDNLGDGKGEVALTPSDAPYTFALRKGAREEVVAGVEDLLETDVPLRLESAALALALVLTVAGFPPKCDAARQR